MADTNYRDPDSRPVDFDQFDDENENFGNKEEYNRSTASYLQMNARNGGSRSSSSNSHSSHSTSSSERSKSKPRSGRSNKGASRGRKKSGPPPSSNSERPAQSHSHRESSHSHSFQQHAHPHPHVQPHPAPAPVAPVPLPTATPRLRRIAMFLHGNELFRAQGELGFDFDYEKLFKYLAGDEQVYNAYFYQTYTMEETKVHGFLNALPRVGYTVRKRLVENGEAAENTGAPAKQITLDLDMVADMIATSDLYDHVILCVNDDGLNFVHAMEILRSRGKEITIVGRSERLSDEFINASDNFMSLEEMKYDIFRPRPGQPTLD